MVYVTVGPLLLVGGPTLVPPTRPYVRAGVTILGAGLTLVGLLGKKKRRAKSRSEEAEDVES